MNYFSCFRKPSIVDTVKSAYIDHQNIHESTRLMSDYLDNKKKIHPIASMHYDILKTHDDFTSSDAVLEHDRAYEWIISYHSKTSSKSLFSCSYWPFYSS